VETREAVAATEARVVAWAVADAAAGVVAVGVAAVVGWAVVAWVERAACRVATVAGPVDWGDWAVVAELGVDVAKSEGG